MPSCWRIPWGSSFFEIPPHSALLGLTQLIQMPHRTNSVRPHFVPVTRHSTSMRVAPRIYACGRNLLRQKPNLTHPTVTLPGKWHRVVVSSCLNLRFLTAWSLHTLNIFFVLNISYYPCIVILLDHLLFHNIWSGMANRCMSSLRYTLFLYRVQVIDVSSTSYWCMISFDLSARNSTMYYP